MRRAFSRSRLPAPLESRRGLTEAEVSERRQQYGPNEIVEHVRHPWRELLRDTARDPMMWFLLGTSALYLVLRQPVEAATLFVAVAPLIGMDAYLHRRTQASTEGLSTRLAARARVLRDGRELEVAATGLVVGDLVLLAAGELFPADGLLVAGEGLQAEESSLTGEAYPVHKQPLAGPLPGGEEPAVEGVHWGFAGTRLLTGSATLRVVFTGAETLYGEIVRMAAQGGRARTPLQSAVAGLVTILLSGAGVMCLFLAFVRWRQGYGWIDALVSAATLAVAALPEEFPVALTFFLGAGVYRLARRQALVRRAVSVENIGRVSFICSDKTGTLTEGRLRVRHLLGAPGVPEEALLRIAALASRREGGDPLDAAILDELERREGPRPGLQVLATFPFTEDRRREAAVVRVPGEGLRAAIKGAPEVVLERCATDEAGRADWLRQVHSLAEAGRKVIAAAWQPVDEGGWAGGEPERGFRFAGLIACEDPVREGVPEAIRSCQEAGIHVLMVTGDHPATARAVAQEIGLLQEGAGILDGEEMEAKLREGGGASLRGVAAVARAVPAQKMALVTALQAAGEIVAVTGDGVNDVPALQAADVGIAMGERGTRSAREVASIVLLDDNFRTLEGAVAEGRQLFHNLRSSFQYLLLIHLPLVLTAALIPLAGYPLLYLPIHIVWLELIIHPTAMLAFQTRTRSGRLARDRPPARARFFSGRDWGFILASGGLLILIILFEYDRALGTLRRVEHARAIALLLLVLASAAFTALLSGLRSRASRWVCGLSVAGSVALIQIPSISALLHLSPLHLDDGLHSAAGALLAAAPVGLSLLFARIGQPPRSPCRPGGAVPASVAEKMAP